MKWGPKFTKAVSRQKFCINMFLLSGVVERMEVIDDSGISHACYRMTSVWSECFLRISADAVRITKTHVFSADY